MEGVLQGEGGTTKQRVEWADLAKGIVIILMIYGHSIEVVSKQWMLIYSFHMPFFILISGFFFKDMDWRRFLRRNIRGMLLPYACTIAIEYVLRIVLLEADWKESLAKMLFTTLTGLSIKGEVSFELAEGVGVLWFVPMLFCVKLLFLLASKCSKGNEFVRMSIVILLVMLGLCLQRNQCYLPWSLDIALYGTGFYYLGLLLRKYDLCQMLFQKARYGLIWLVIWFVGVSSQFQYEMVMRSYTGEIICMFAAVSGFLLCCMISDYLSKVKGIKGFFGWMGRGTMAVLCLHHLEREFIRYEDFGMHLGHRLFVVRLLLIVGGYLLITSLTFSWRRFILSGRFNCRSV